MISISPTSTIDAAYLLVFVLPLLAILGAAFLLISSLLFRQYWGAYRQAPGNRNWPYTGRRLVYLLIGLTLTYGPLTYIHFGHIRLQGYEVGSADLVSAMTEVASFHPVARILVLVYAGILVLSLPVGVAIAIHIFVKRAPAV